MTVDSQKQIEMQRLQTEHLKRQQEHIMQHNIQELQAQMTKSQLSMSGPQSLMFLPFLEQLRGLPVQSPMPPPPATSTATTGNKHINSIANVREMVTPGVAIGSSCNVRVTLRDTIAYCSRIRDVIGYLRRDLSACPLGTYPMENRTGCLTITAH